MTDLFKPKYLLFLCAALLLFPSCAGEKAQVVPKTPMPAPASSRAASQAQKQVEAGHYQKAIEIYSDEHRKNPQDRSLAREYAKSLESIKSAGDQRFEKGELAAACRMYHALHINYAKFRGMEQTLSFDHRDLDEKLTYCKKTLSKQGFEEYRKGNLSQAIRCWQGLLAIDPNNKAIKDALRTARQQQKNLQDDH